ncbi:MAG: oxidoreductase [Planctomycetes bacterium]|nr:oxidoreductase [Planctomycetota bacterium]
MRRSALPMPLACAWVLCACSSVRPDPEFEPLETGVRVSLRGLSVPSPDVVWASGATGTVIRSIDAGRTWQVHQVPGAEALDFRSLHAFDANRAVLATAGTPARIYRTADGGDTFELAWESPFGSAFFDAIAFWDDRHGIAFSDPVEGAFYIVVTADAGAHWDRVPVSALPEPLLGEAGFAASGSGLRLFGMREVIVGTGGGDTARVLRSRDRGRSWTVHDTPVRAGDPAAGIFSIAVRGERVIAVGGRYLDPDLGERSAAYSTDGGVTWRPSEPMPSGYRSSVAWFDLDGRPIAVAVGRNGADVTDDLGASWRRVGSAPFQAIRSSPSGSTGFAVGAGGSAARVRF